MPVSIAHQSEADGIEVSPARTEESAQTPPLSHLAACVTFFYTPERVHFLHRVISCYATLASRLDLYIITNTIESQRTTESIFDIPSSVHLQFVVRPSLGHPYFLTWMHQEIFEDVLSAKRASHFLYSEDDLLLTRENVNYWLRYRTPLQEHGLIPSFFRVEQHPARGWVSSDCMLPTLRAWRPQVRLSDGSLFICMPNPYQGLYFLDRPLMEEYSTSPARSPDFGRWPIREKAAQGLTFVNVPKGFSSRNVCRLTPDANAIARESWIHHLPNTYANLPASRFGKLPAEGKGVFAGVSGVVQARIRHLINKANKGLAKLRNTTVHPSY